MPTVAKLIGAKLPDHKIDGEDIRPLMFAHPQARSPHEAFYCYYRGGQLQAIRDRQWKLHFPHSYRTLAGRAGGTQGKPVQYSQAKTNLELYDLKNDVGETTNLVDKHPEIVRRLQEFAAAGREDLGDRLNNRPGKGIRPAGKLPPGDAQLVW